MSHRDCPACLAIERLKITEEDAADLVHTLMTHMLDYTEIARRARQIDFDLSNVVIDTVAESIARVAAAEHAAVPRGYLN